MDDGCDRWEPADTAQFAKFAADVESFASDAATSHLLARTRAWASETVRKQRTCDDCEHGIAHLVSECGNV
jgi:hypothetical protein